MSKSVMGSELRGWGRTSDRSVTVSFGHRFAASEQFDGIFRQGMELVERAAAYLDGAGRQEAKRLAAPVGLIYATESMRLTTRLLDLASWLLIRRSLRDGDITEEEARRKRARIRLRPLGRPGHISRFDELPAGLRELIEQSYTLSGRIARLDSAMNEPVTAPAPHALNPVAAQLAELQAAFNAPPR